MTKTFNRMQKQVDDRVKHRRPRGSIHVLVHDLLVYCLEVRTFHVKQMEAVRQNSGTLQDHEVELLVAGETLEERTKAWLAGE